VNVQKHFSYTADTAEYMVSGLAQQMGDGVADASASLKKTFSDQRLVRIWAPFPGPCCALPTATLATGEAVSSLSAASGPYRLQLAQSPLAATI
jgi:hypothetical protein